MNQQYNFIKEILGECAEQALCNLAEKHNIRKGDLVQEVLSADVILAILRNAAMMFNLDPYRFVEDFFQEQAKSMLGK